MTDKVSGAISKCILYPVYYIMLAGLLCQIFAPQYFVPPFENITYFCISFYAIALCCFSPFIIIALLLFGKIVDEIYGSHNILVKNALEQDKAHQDALNGIRMIVKPLSAYQWVKAILSEVISITAILALFWTDHIPTAVIVWIFGTLVFAFGIGLRHKCKEVAKRLESCGIEVFPKKG